jgi:hypothetical protein
MMTCGGFSSEIMGGCSFAWAGLAILFFIIALCRKWLGEEMQIPFNFLLSLIVGFLAYIIIIIFTGNYKFAMAAGLLGAAAGGFGAGYFMGEGEVLNGE